MLSERKRLLYVAEAVALAGAAAALALAVRSHWHPEPAFPAFLAACVGLAWLMLAFAPACILCGQCARALRADAGADTTDGLNAKEIAALIRWAPQPYRWAAGAGIVILVTTVLRFGGIDVAENQPADPEDVTGAALYFSVFFLLALPVLGSAARMSGDYGDQCRP
ncbi:hypothetical protein [Roseateles sp.]|uniref:hypothetical protein n=1 Tax=Roseateles sp. TaxID=1971397 RepID=UPI0032657579